MTDSPPMTFTEPLTEAQSAKMEGWLREDLNSGKITQEMYDRATQPQPTTQPSSAPAPPVVPAVTTGPMTALSIAERLKAGTLTNAQAGQLARSGGIDAMEIAKAHSILSAPIEAKAPDLRSPEIQLLDQHFPPAKPHEYRIDHGIPAGQTMTSEQTQFDASARAWISGAEFSKSLGDAFITAITRTACAWTALPAEKREAQHVANVAANTRALSAQQLEQLDAMVDAVPGALDFIAANQQIIAHPLITNLLVQQAARWHMRRKPQ